MVKTTDYDFVFWVRVQCLVSDEKNVWEDVLLRQGMKGFSAVGWTKAQWRCGGEACNPPSLTTGHRAISVRHQVAQVHEQLWRGFMQTAFHKRQHARSRQLCVRSVENTCCSSLGGQDENRSQDPSARPDRLMVELLVSSGSLKNHSVYNSTQLAAPQLRVQVSTSRSSESTFQIRPFTTVCAP